MSERDIHIYSLKTDEELAQLCKEEDQRAFQELMRRYMRPIWNFVRQYAKSDEDAEDIAQDTFFKTWKNIRQFQSGRTWKPWLFTIARNTALDQLKKKKAAPFSDLDSTENELSFADTLADPEPLAPEIFETAALVGKLKNVLETLNPDHRAVLMLHYRDDMTFEEIARVVGKPMNTVKSWHRRALIRIKEMLEDAHE